MALTQAPALRPHHRKTAQAGPEALSTFSLPTRGGKLSAPLQSSGASLNRKTGMLLQATKILSPVLRSVWIETFLFIELKPWMSYELSRLVTMQYVRFPMSNSTCFFEPMVTVPSLLVGVGEVGGRIHCGWFLAATPRVRVPVVQIIGR